MDLSYDLFFIIFSTVIILGISFITLKKNKFLSLGNLYLFFYSVLFLIGIKLYLEDNIHDFRGQSLFNLLHLILIIYLFCTPLLKLPRKDVPFVSTNRSLVKVLYRFTIIFSVISLYEAYQNLTSGGLLLLFTDSSYGNEAYAETRAGMDIIRQEGRSLSYLSIITGQALQFAPFLFIYSIIDPYSRKIEKVLLGFCVLFKLLNAVSIGSRFGIVVPVMQCAFFYFFISKYVAPRLNKLVIMVGIWVGLFLGAALVAISVSRAEGAGRQENMFMYYDAYASEGILFYGKYAVDHGENRQGERIFPLVKRALGYNNVADSYIKRLQKFKRMTITEVNFITFAGDFMLDFGFLMGNIILLLLIIFYRTALAKLKRIGFAELCVIYMLIVTLNGFSLYVFTDVSGNFFFFLLLALYFFTKRRKVSYVAKQA